MGGAVFFVFEEDKFIENDPFLGNMVEAVSFFIMFANKAGGHEGVKDEVGMLPMHGAIVIGKSGVSVAKQSCAAGNSIFFG